MNTVSLLVATALSDAHGLGVENMSRQRIARRYPDGLPSFLLAGGRGLASDDTEHAALTAIAFVRSAGDPERFERELSWGLRRWLWALPAATGLATLRALIKLSVGISSTKSGVDSAGNGACMRAPILGVLAHDPDHLWQLVYRSSRMTHRDPRAIEGAYAVSLWAHLVRARGASLSMEELISCLPRSHVPSNSEVRAALGRVKDSLDHGQSTFDFLKDLGCDAGPTGFVMHTVPAVFHVLLQKEGSWESKVRSAVLLGGDTDSVAALVGALASLLPGSALPSSWSRAYVDAPYSLEFLQQKERAALSSSRSALSEDMPWPSYPNCLARNAVFTCIVFGEALRRLLPPY